MLENLFLLVVLLTALLGIFTIGAAIAEYLERLVMKQQRLPDDCLRCRDDNCPKHTHCLRWTQRDIGGPRLVFVESCFPFELHHGTTDQCPAYIPDDFTKSPIKL